MFAFEISHADRTTRARVGRVMTPHGAFDTPAFMPVGTAGSIKGVLPDVVDGTGTQILLANTYHLMLRPTAEVVADLGGLHRFMGWNRPILTDSGGYQVFSLAKINTISDEGVEFRSHIDGAALRLDAKIAMDVQNKLGADIIMAFDQCPPLPCERDVLEQAVSRTARWAKLCKRAHRRDDQWLFGIVQGGADRGLRRECAHRLMEIGFDGYAVGGLSVGESHEDMVEVLAELCPHLPPDQPRYLMGVGTPRDLYACVQQGIDMFDCVLPTRNGRNAYAFTARGPVRMRNERHRCSNDPLEDGCDCGVCARFSRGYLRHLFLAGEMLGPVLTTIHNLRFFQRLMGRMRDLIPQGKLATIPAEFPIVQSGDVHDEL